MMYSFSMLLIFILTISNTGLLAITCISGTKINNGVCNTTNENDVCIQGNLSTPFLSSYPPTEIYMCGNCSNISTIKGIQNVTCCNSSDFCQVIQGGTYPDPTSCDAMSNQDSCLNSRNDCYWCNDTMNTGYGTCRSLTGFPFSCFIMSSLITQPVCEKIICPIYKPAYTVSDKELTKKYLTDFGFPSLNEELAIQLATDISFSEIRILNDTNSYCQVQTEVEEWCGLGGNTLKSFKYCLASEKWPQSDLGGWIMNTTFTSSALYFSGFYPFFPSVCLCPKAGRGYYIPSKKIIAEQHYSYQCKGEHALLAFYILVILLTLSLLIYVLREILYLCYMAYKKKGYIKTIFAKIVICIFCIFNIVCLITYVIPSGNDGSHQAVSILFRFFGVVTALLAFVVTVFTFLDILTSSAGDIMFKSETIKMLLIFRYIFLAFTIINTIAVLVLITITSVIFTKLFAFDYNSISHIVSLITPFEPMVKSYCLIQIITQGIVIIVTATILIYIGVSLKSFSSLIGKRVFRDLSIRYIGLVIALCCSIAPLALYITTVVLGAWIFPGLIYNPFGVGYASHIAFLWFTLALMASELMMVGCLTYSMRTKTKKSWLYNHFKKFIGLSSTSDTSINTNDSNMNNTDD